MNAAGAVVAPVRTCGIEKPPRAEGEGQARALPGTDGARAAAEASRTAGVPGGGSADAPMAEAPGPAQEPTWDGAGDPAEPPPAAGGHAEERAGGPAPGEVSDAAPKQAEEPPGEAAVEAP